MHQAMIFIQSINILTIWTFMPNILFSAINDNLSLLFFVFVIIKTVG